MVQKEYKKRPDIWVAYKTPRKNSKVQIECFKDVLIDDILVPNKRKPLLSDSYEILDIGIGEAFGEHYRKKYKIV